MRTYLIEPQLLFVPFLKRLLSGAGLQVVATGDEIDAKDLSLHDPDVVFVDVDFFERGALNALCRIRQSLRSAAVIAFSDTEDANFEASCFISGASAVVSKAASADQLLRTLRSVLGTSAALAHASANA
ncbi:MAG: response regulator [Vulcanimicrobiaceae bacterium]